MNREYVENLINDLKAIEFGKDYIINGNELCELKKYLIDIHKQIDQLTNKWNELEEYIKNEWKVVAKSPDGSFYDGYDTCMEEMKEDILDKMKEIKGEKE